jgi:vacuolar-type H+-ATPase subunit H
MNKTLKISAIVLIGILVVILLLPFVFKGKITRVVQDEINKNLNAEVTFKGIGLSLIRHFPDLTVNVNDLNVKGVTPFEKDTLASIPALRLTVNLASVFRGSDYEIKQIKLTSPKLLFKVLADGRVNWDVMKAGTTTDTVSEPSNFKALLNKIEITDGRFVYDDAELPTYVDFNGITGTLKGDMTVDVTTLDADVVSKSVIIDYDGVRYMNNIAGEVKTKIQADITNWIFTFTGGLLKLNDLDLTADGYFAMPDEGYRMDIKFTAKENTFKSFLSLIPAVYAKDFSNLKASGTMSLGGWVKGLYSDDSIPAFDVDLKVNNGSFSYPSLPGNVSDVNLLANFANPDGVIDHTVVDVSKLHLKMMQNPVDATLLLKTPVSDPDINATLKGRIDLSDVSRIYPLGDKTTLSGILDADAAFAGKLSSIENGAYDKFKADGYLAVDKVVYTGEGVKQPVNISKARLDFTPAYAQLSGMTVAIGKNDISAEGKLENYLPYFMKKNGVLKGSLTTTSKYMDINSLVAGSESSSTSTDTSALTVIEIPGDMDLTLNTTFGQLLYDKYDLQDVKGQVFVKDKILQIGNLSMNTLGGTMAMKGSYSTVEPAKPKVDIELNIKNIDVSRTVAAFNTMKQLAPIAEKLTGAITTTLKFKGDLKENMMPELTSVSAYGLLLSDILKFGSTNTFSKIADALKMDKLRNPSVEKVNLSFDLVNGIATVKPMDFKLASYKANFSGTTGLDKAINFVLTLDIPRSDFGSKANTVLESLVGDAAKKGVNVKLGDIVPVTLLIGGTVTDPTIRTGIKTAMTDLVADVKQQALEQVEKKKEELVNKAKDEANALIVQADAQAAKLIADAETQGQKLVDAAQVAAGKVRTTADSTASKLISEGKKNGPIAEIAAKKAADKVKKEADAKATGLVSEAQKQKDALIAKARTDADKLKQDAQNKVK